MASEYFVPSLKMCPTSIVLTSESGFVAHGTRLAVLHLAQIEPALHFDVAIDVDAAQMEPIVVRARHHVAPAL